jgi:hypothetical protein
MKYKGGNFVQVRREVFNGKYDKLSKNARWLYCVLSELEHKYTGENEDFFFRALSDLSKDAHMKRNTVVKAKKELVSAELIKTWQMHWMNKETKKKSEKHVTAYRLL